MPGQGTSYLTLVEIEATRETFPPERLRKDGTTKALAHLDRIVAEAEAGGASVVFRSDRYPVAVLRMPVPNLVVIWADVSTLAGATLRVISSDLQGDPVPGEDDVPDGQGGP